MIGSGAFFTTADGTKLASSVGDLPIQIWDVTTGKKLRQIEVAYQVAFLTFSPDNKILVWCDGGVHLREVETGKEPYHFEGHDEPVDFLAFSGDGKTLTSSAWDHTVRIWDSMTGKPVKQFPIPRAYYGGTSTLCKDGKTWAFTPDVNSICLWDVERGKQVAKIKKAKHYASYLSFLPDGKTLISFGEGGTYFWEVATGKEVRHLDRGFGGAFSLDGTTAAEEVLIYPDDEVQVNKIDLLDIRTGEKQAQFASPGGVSPLVFSPDGKSLAAGDARIWWSCFSRPTEEDQTLRVFEVPRGKQQAQFKVPHKGISVIAFSADGTMLACGDHQGTICLFDLKKQRELAKLQGHSNVISCLAFSRDGKALASGSYDTTALVWDVNKLKK